MALDDYDKASKGELVRDCKILSDFLALMESNEHRFSDPIRISIATTRSAISEPFKE